MIKKIEKLKHPGVLRDYSWPTGLPTFGRFNLIYGWNGTGKTTISRVFRDLELQRSPQDYQVELGFESTNIRGEGFPQSKVPIRVFNRDFVTDIVFPVSGGDVPPIFIFGKESVEKQKEVDQLKAERDKKQAELKNTQAAKEQTADELDKHCIEQAKVIKETLRKTNSAYNNYDKTNYKKQAQQLTTDGNAASHRLSDKQRDSFLAQHHATPKQKVPEITYQLPQLQILAEHVAKILQTTVVSSAIEALKDDSTLAQWVHQGLRLHKDRQSNTCLFCEQPLPSDRLRKLEDHFNAAYEQFLKQIDEQIRVLTDNYAQAAQARVPNQAELYDDLQSDFVSAEMTFRSAIDSVRKYLAVLVEHLDRKRTKPFENLSLTEDAPNLDKAAIDKLNEVIHRHNKACDEFETRVKEARNRLANDMIARNLDDFVRLRDAAQAAQAAIGPIEQDINQLTAKIDALEREIREHRRPAEELNEELNQYLGHNELQLKIKENGYSIIRNGQPAQNLSEGEMTAIAILYFLKSLQDRNFNLQRGIVVLDDPVSSLDANALYLAFGFIRQRTQDAGQLFILTHNFAFFRQVRNWYRHLKGQNKRDVNQRPARFYMLDRVNGSNPRCSTLRALDPLLEQYESEYHYLFGCVHRAAKATGETMLEQNYCLPNIARRLLEMFLAFRRPQIAGELWQKLKDISFDEAKKVRIVRFMHTHSHGDMVGEPEHDPSLLGEAQAVLDDLLELIRSEDPQHFAAMMKLVAGPANEGDSE